MNEILRWEELIKYEIEDIDRVNGFNNSYAKFKIVWAH